MISAVRLSSRSSSSLFDSCGATLGGRYRFPFGKNVPTYLSDYLRALVHQLRRAATATAPRRPSRPGCIPEDGNRFFPGTDASAIATGHTGGDTWVADAAIEMMTREPWSGMFVTMGAIDKAAHMWGAQNDAATFMGRATRAIPWPTVPPRRTFDAPPRTPTSNSARCWTPWRRSTRSDGGETLVVLTADHGATYGEHFYGKDTADAGDSNWYYAPDRGLGRGRRSSPRPTRSTTSRRRACSR